MTEKKSSILEFIRELFSSIGWRLFLWARGLTADEYWEMIYQQESARMCLDGCVMFDEESDTCKIGGDPVCVCGAWANEWRASK